MTSKASLSKKLIHKGLFHSDLKRFWWVSALYTIALVLMLPVDHLLQSTSEENTWAWDGLKAALNLTTGYSEFQIILTYLVPVFLAVLLFMYLHSSRATATIHSLPTTRKQLFFTHWGVGIVLLTIPVIITGLALIAVQQMTLLRDIYSVGTILSWIGYTLLFNIFFFSLAVFVGMFTGTPITQAVFTYILILLPIGLYELIRYNLSQLLFGYSNFNLHQSFIDSLPLYALTSNFVGEGLFTTGYVVGTLITIFAAFALALYAYRARNLEAAGDVIAFPIVRPIFKYGVTICTMLLVGAYFASVSGNSLAAVIFGYLFGSLLGYFIAEILLQKSLKIWRQSYKGYLAYALLLVLTLFAVQGDVFGFEKRVPTPEEVEEVFFGTNLYSWVDMNNRVSNETSAETEDYHYYHQSGQSGGWTLKSPENIRNIVNLHKQLVQEEDPKGNRPQFMVYSLKNGKNLIRQYSIDEQKFAGLLKPIYESTEYKEARFPVFRQTPNEVKMIEVSDSRTPKEPIILANDAEISQLMEALRQDLQSLTFEEMNIWKNNGPVVVIRDMKNRGIDYSIRDNYSSTFKWLSEKEYLEKTILQLQEIEYAVLNASQREANNIEITDADLIAELLEKCGRSNYSGTDEEITVFFHVKSNYGTYQFQESIWKDASVSPELKQYLDQSELAPAVEKSFDLRLK